VPLVEDLRGTPNLTLDRLGAGRDIIVSVGDRSASLCVPVPGTQAPVAYVDRPELTGPLLIHLLEVGPKPRGRAIISAVHGLGGIGKTTVARWLVWRPEIEERYRDGRIWVTLGGDSDLPDAIAVISDCVSRLDPAIRSKTTVDAVRADLAALLQDKAVLFVIDDVWPGKSAEVAKALIVPSLHSSFLLTTRFPQLADDPEIGAENFSLDEMGYEQSIELIVLTLGHALNATERGHAKRLSEIVGGHPLALELAIARIKGGRPWENLLDDLTAEIARLGALEDTDTDLIADPIAGRTKLRRTSLRASLLLSVRYLSRTGQRLFAWLGVVAEDAIVTPRMAATLWSEEEEAARRHLRGLSGLGLVSTKGDAFSIHDLMLDLAREVLTAPEIAAQAGNISGLGLTWENAHRRFLERYREKSINGVWHTLPDDGYIYDHLVWHLEEAGCESELRNLLWAESTDRHCGWHQARELLGQNTGFLSDVGRVWSYADRFGAAAGNEALRAPAIALQVHCALIMASISNLSAGIPVEVLVGGVQCEILSLPSALVLARQHPDPQTRIAALLALDNEMQRSHAQGVLDAAFEVARGIDDLASRVEAMMDVATRLPADKQPGAFDEILRAARGIHEARKRAKALAKLAELLPAAEALAIARGIENAEWRASTIVEVAKRLPAEGQPCVLKEVLALARGVDVARRRAHLIATIAQLLPAEERSGLFREALCIARDINDLETRAFALSETVEQLPIEDQPNVLDETRRAACDIPPYRRAEVLMCIAPKLPLETQRAVFSEVLTLARGQRSLDRDSLLKQMVELLPLSEAAAVAREINITFLREDALASVARRLPAKEALEVARSINDIAKRGDAMAEIALRMPLEDALAVARGIDHAESRARAIAGVAGRLASADRPRLLVEALAATRRIDDDESCSSALAAIARWLPPEEALGVARGIGNAGLRATAIAEAAQRLPAEERADVLREALVLARSNEGAASRAKSLSEIAQRMPLDEQPRVLDEALSAARAIIDADERDFVLAQIAQWVPVKEALAISRELNDELRWSVMASAVKRLPGTEAIAAAGEIMEEFWRYDALAYIAQQLPPVQALEIARSIDYAPRRVEALAEIALRFAPEDQPSVLGEALSIARDIRDAWPRTIALGAVAERLPAEGRAGVLAEALGAACNTDDDWSRDRAIAEIAKWLPADEALALARGIGSPWAYSMALNNVAERLSADEALALAREISDRGYRSRAMTNIALRIAAEKALAVGCEIGEATSRTKVLAEVSERLASSETSAAFSFSIWTEAIRLVGLRKRRDSIADFGALVPLVHSLGGDTAVRDFGRSISAVSSWWP
jgi:NB-ARC domain-containing protein/apoptotic protease-activating factor 1-like protein